MITLPEPRTHFGRAWKVEIIATKKNPDGQTYDDTIYTFGSDTWEPEGLHIQFNTEQSYAAYWLCDLTIYNLNLPSIQDMIEYGMTMRLSAGYQSELVRGNLGIVFEGMIFQPLWERENAITDKLTLHCMA